MEKQEEFCKFIKSETRLQRFSKAVLDAFKKASQLDQNYDDNRNVLKLIERLESAHIKSSDRFKAACDDYNNIAKNLLSMPEEELQEAERKFNALSINEETHKKRNNFIQIFRKYIVS